MQYNHQLYTNSILLQFLVHPSLQKWFRQKALFLTRNFVNNEF